LHGSTFAGTRNVTYYAVDHSPSYLWDSATWAISEAVLPEIRYGAVLNPKILSFQKR